MKHFLHISDYSDTELWEILNLAKDLKAKFHQRADFKHFKNRSLAMIFAKPSARTRVSFETGFEWMGGHALFLGPNDIGIGKREAIKEISRLFSRYNDVMMARLFDHEHIIELAEYSTIPVINGLTDYNHPCQIMTDIFTVWEHMGKIEKPKIVYMGDGNNIVHSWLHLAMRIPMDFVCCCPGTIHLIVVQFRKQLMQKFQILRYHMTRKKLFKMQMLFILMYGHQWGKKRRHLKEKRYFQVFK